MKPIAMDDHNISAVIFDLDGTLLSTEHVTRNILKEFLATYGKVPEEEKESKRVGMTQKESAKFVIRNYDLPLTPEQYTQQIMPFYQGKWSQANALPGANHLMEHLHKHGVPFALASNSVRKNIDAKISYQKGWKDRFAVILGSDQVKAGKPSPDIFLEAANRLGVDPANCLVIEDSIIGVKAAKAAEMKVVAIPSLLSNRDQYSIAHCVLHSLLEFRPELWRLPPFFYSERKCLPIDPIQIKCFFSNGLLHEFTDDDLSSLPDQLFGVHFGWAKLDTSEIVKVVISLGWEDHFGLPIRKIRARFLDRHEQIYENNIQLLVVGYIRGSHGEGIKLNHFEIRDEDMTTADAVLNLPEFSYNSCNTFSEKCINGNTN